MPETDREESELLQPETRSVKRTRAERYGVFYANNTEVGATPWDVRLKFAQLQGGDETSIFVEDQCDIVLSLQHAKAVALIMLQHIRNYEAAFGKLAIPMKDESEPATPKPPKVESGKEKT